MEEVPIRQPGPTEVLVKIKAAAICGTDIHIYQWNNWAANLYQGRLPMPMGHEFCGVVEAVGSEVSTIQVGDRVCAETHLFCGSCDKCKQNMENICDNLTLFTQYGAGCFSEYTTVPAACLIKVPEALSDIEGALMEPFGVAVYAVETAQISGRSVLIQGCGPIGLLAILAARALGASRVYAVEAEPYRIELAKQAGADEVLDPMSGQVPERIMELTGGIGVRSVCEFTGNIRAIETGFRCIAKGGRYVFTGLPAQKLELDIAKDLVNKELTLIGCYGRKIYQTWVTAFELLLSGKVDLSSVVTHRSPLTDYEAAFQAAVSRKSGKVVLLNQAL